MRRYKLSTSGQKWGVGKVVAARSQLAGDAAFLRWMLPLGEGRGAFGREGGAEGAWGRWNRESGMLLKT